MFAAGFAHGAVAHRITTGRLHIVHKGVYAIGYVPGNFLGTAMAAVLACGRAAALSHRSAAALWEIGPTHAGPIDVSSPGKRHHNNIRHHRARLATHEVTTCRGIPVTNVARTIIDLARVVDDRVLARAVNEARVQHHVDLDDLRRAFTNANGHQGVGRLRQLIDPGQPPTRSALEDEFLAFVKRHRLPKPEINQRIAGYEVDMLWRAQRLVAELDGRRFHDHPRAFETDRDKDADLLTAGYRVVRITWRRLTHDPQREAQRLRLLLREAG